MNIDDLDFGLLGRKRKGGMVRLEWTKSRQSRARLVSFYSIERRTMACGNGDLGALWRQVASSIKNEISLTEEPLGVRMEYRIKAVNKAGESGPTNTIAVVL